MRPRLLILGGTAEAIDLARRCLDRFAVVSSLAGATEHPVHPPGEVRIGGFGGVDGLERYLRDVAIDAVVDATHPFAARMQANAAQACARVVVPRCRLLRPPWPRLPGDRWIEVDDVEEAASALRALGPRVFVALGARDLAAFESLSDRWFLVRAVSRPGALPARGTWLCLQARGPFALDAERRLLVEHRIDVLVSRQSGGEGARAKIDAARALGLPVVMIRRPAPPVPPVVPGVDEAMAWLSAVRAKGLAPAAPPGAV
jgi:precorrin-6A/cobalt-precorrin-6A reductase